VAGRRAKKEPSYRVMRQRCIAVHIDDFKLHMARTLATIRLSQLQSSGRCSRKCADDEMLIPLNPMTTRHGWPHSTGSVKSWSAGNPQLGPTFVRS